MTDQSNFDKALENHRIDLVVNELDVHDGVGERAILDW